MSEVRVKDVKNILSPEPPKLDNEGDRVAGVQDKITEHAARLADICRRLGEISVELAGVTQGVEETTAVYGSVKDAVGRSGDTIRRVGEESPQLTEVATALGAAVQAVDRGHGYLTATHTSLGERTDMLRLIAEELGQGAGAMHGVATDAAQVGAVVGASAKEVRTWIAVT